MSISSGTILKVVVSLLLPDTVIAQNVFYTVVADLVTSDDEEDVISDVIDWVEGMYGQLNTYLVDVAAASDVKIYEYDSIDDDWDEVGTDVWTDGFASADDMLPHGVAAVLHARTFDPDVSASKYIPALTELIAADSDISGSPLGAIGDFADDWVTAFVGSASGGTFGPGVWSTVGTVFKLFNGSYTLNGILGYQRRRKPGVGI